MVRFAIPVILIGISVASFFFLVSPMYSGENGITALRAQIVSYNEALDNSKALESERDKLTQKYNSIDPDNLEKLKKFLPDSVDNIRLILEIEQLAAPYGMVLRDVKYDTNPKAEAKPSTGTVVAGGAAPTVVNKNYGTWDLEFSTEGTYNNFLNFLKIFPPKLLIGNY